jgi:alkyl sulfatase BDS1-like metallo-beta-lactamase superfamily hydrolase
MVNNKPLTCINGSVFVRCGLANVTVVDLGNGSLLLIDTSTHMFAGQVIKETKQLFPNHLIEAALFTHGHYDHVGAFSQWDRALGPIPTVIAHKNALARFDRYSRTRAYNGLINTRQFGVKVEWPEQWPNVTDVLGDEKETRTLGKVRFDIYHGLGETDDALWVHFPEQKLLCTGDFIIWASPNCGNPQKQQRYAKEWAQTLRTMASIDGVEFLIPGHGPPISGRDRIQTMLGSTAEYLEILEAATLDKINQGWRLDDVIKYATSQLPDHLTKLPFLQPIYDEPEFVVRGIWRRYAGWYDGNPATLKPGDSADLANEIISLSGGRNKLLERVVQLSQEGSDKALTVASFLVEYLNEVYPDSAEVGEIRKQIYLQRVELASSTMSKGIFRAASARL